MYYDQKTKLILKELETSQTTGLTTEQAEERLAKFGPNTFKSEEKTSPLKVFLHTLKEPIIIILWIAIALSLGSASYDFLVKKDYSHGVSAIYEAIAIFIIIMVNSGVTFWQSLQAQKSLDSLKKMADHTAQVLRDGDWVNLKTELLVPGDIVNIRLGDFIEGDIRFLSTNELQVNESHLTGESDVIAKKNVVLEKDTPLGDRINLGFSGSTVLNGSGIGVVIATGMQTELGKISELLQQTTSLQTPIEKTINALTKKLMYIAGGTVVFVLAYGLIKEYMLHGQITVEALMADISQAIAIAVAAIPDAMPVVLSIVLTIGATLLSRNNGLVKSLNSVETLGATTFICSDKTGTLTKNEMTVTNFFANGQNYQVTGHGYEPVGEISLENSEEQVELADIDSFLSAAILNNEAQIRQNPDDGRYQPFGNPTDVSLIVLGEKAGLNNNDLLNQADPDYNILRVFPFESTRKMMSMIVQKNDEYYVLTKGAPDVIFERTTKAQMYNEIVDFEAVRPQFEQEMLDFAEDALRTLAVAERKIDEDLAENGELADLEKDLTILGIAGIIDPPRPEVKKSIAKLKGAGVIVVMITGDHAATARAIAHRLGIIEEPDALVVTGQELATIDDEHLKLVVKDARVYARVTPADKQRVVKALQENAEVVAMTGDGVNDAPALKAADIGIAMGINGTEVTKDSADLILLDDKFTTIEKSVEAGRRIFGNIKNFIRQELITNVAEVLSLLLILFFMTKQIGQVSSLTPTLTAVMVLWVNMISDSLPSFSLGFDQAESDSMKQKPRDLSEPILNKTMVKRIAVRGIAMGVLVALSFIWAAHQGFSPAQTQTVAFLTLVFGQLWHIFDTRSNRSIFHRNPFDNKILLFAVAFAAIASVLATYLPVFHKFVGTARIPEWLILCLILVSSIPTLVISGIKEIYLKLKNSKKISN